MLRDDETTTFLLPPIENESPVRVIQLTFKEDVRMYPTKPEELYKESKNEKAKGYY